MPKIRVGLLAWLLALLAVVLAFGESAVVFADDGTDVVSLAVPDPPDAESRLPAESLCRPTDAWRRWT